MTEAEWLTCADPVRMLGFLETGWGERFEIYYSGRKFRLFACACCRLYWHLLTDPRGQRAVEVAELYADELITEEERRKAEDEANRQPSLESPASAGTMATASTWVAAHSSNDRWDMFGVARVCLGCTLDLGQRPPPAPTVQPEHLRCIFGNPFRPVTVDPSWLTSTAISLARQMYESRDFSAMPILADALQDAGCDHNDVLAHCRGPGQHTRGCWVVDCLLGKT